MSETFAAELLEDFRRRNIQISLAGDEIVIDHDDNLTDADLEVVDAHENEIVSELSNPFCPHSLWVKTPVQPPTAPIPDARPIIPSPVFPSNGHQTFHACRFLPITISGRPELPDLSPEQNSAVSALREGVSRNVQIQTMGGYAGTGKTTSIKALKHYLGSFSVCAYTGKAANVLRRKGIEAGTIHSLIYMPQEDAKGRVFFRLKTKEELYKWNPRIGGFIVDEASMVGRTIYNDMASFRLPCIFVGDHGQLEPVERTEFNLMRSPQYTLETIHRNSGEIPRFAEWLRKGREARGFEESREAVKIIRPGSEAARKKSIDELLLATDQAICAYNRTRVKLNKRVRKLLGKGEMPEDGDRIICLRNSRRDQVFNGMQGVARNVRIISENAAKIDFESDEGTVHPVEVDLKQFNNPKPPDNSKPLWDVPFDYAYAISAHKSQGSEWENVLVIEQKCFLWEHRRWAYTCASRAQKSVTWISEGVKL